VRFPIQTRALEPRKEVGRPKGLFRVKGNSIPWVMRVERKERVGRLEFVVE